MELLQKKCGRIIIIILKLRLLEEFNFLGEQSQYQESGNKELYMILPQTIEQVQNSLTEESFKKLIGEFGLLLNTGLNGQPDGYVCQQRGFLPNGFFGNFLRLAPTAIFEFTLHPDHPLMYIDPQFNVFQTDRHFFTDKGSIPTIFKWKFSPDECLWFFYHDSAYMYHGLWRMIKTTGKFEFESWSQKNADDGLHDGYLIQWPQYSLRADTIWAALRCGGSFAWNKKRNEQELEWRAMCSKKQL